jgi:response regulator of citrate/malate metabolism
MSAIEQHYTPTELAKMWGISRQTVRVRLEKYLHLIPDLNTKGRSRFGPIKRPHTELRIPKSVVEMIYRDFLGSRRSI